MSSFGQVLIGIVCAYFVVLFIQQQNIDVEQVRIALFTSNVGVMALAIAFVGVFIALQGYMYYMSFRAIGVQLPFWEGVQLYLKRNFLSAFLPGGSITNMFFFTKRLEKKYKFTRLSIYTGSSLFTLATYIGIPLISLPLIVRLLMRHESVGWVIRPVAGITSLISLTIAVIVWLGTRNVQSVRLQTYSPKLVDAFAQLRQERINYKCVGMTILAAVGVEIIGIVHMYLALRAIGAEPQRFVASIGYLIAMILLMSSPFLRGAGAIELALAYFFSSYGISDVHAVIAGFLFRFFEFWILLVLGIFVLVLKRHTLVARIFPSLLMIALGIVLAISSLKSEASEYVEDYIFLLLAAVILTTGSLLVKGKMYARWLAFISVGIVLSTQIAYGEHYLELSLAAFTFLVLLYERKHYS